MKAVVCPKCHGDGCYCWTCGEPEWDCNCDDRNIGTCDFCSGTGSVEELVGG